MSRIAISTRGLEKRYGAVHALQGIDLEVMSGEVFGILGPNGAGKTTTIDCVAGMKTWDAGEISVLGMDPGKSREELKRRIGLQQQESELPERIRVNEALELFAELFGVKARVQELLSMVGLSQKEKSYFTSLSGGQKKRLFVALALVHDPELVILDELTSGLDPAGRRQLWTMVRHFRSMSKTVVLSTHYMDEAEELCDRVAIVNEGRIIAVDSPGALIGKYCPGMVLRLGCGSDFQVEKALSVPGVLKAEIKGEECVMKLSGPEVVVPVIQVLSNLGVSLGNLSTKTPDLEDVFLVATGREFSHE